MGIKSFQGKRAEPEKLQSLPILVSDYMSTNLITFTKDQLDDIRSQQQQDNQELHSRFPLPESRLMNIYIQQREPVDSPKSTTQLIL